MRPEPALSYVRDLIDTLTGTRPEPDGDGDLPVSWRGADFYVRVIGQDAIVQVFSVVLADLPADPELTVALNDINTQLKFARIFHVADQVLIELDIWADDVDPANFGDACHKVAAASDHFGRRLLEVFGGTPRWEHSKSDDYQPPDAPGGGLYL